MMNAAKLAFALAVIVVFMGAGCGKDDAGTYPGDEPYRAPTAPPPAN